MKLIITLLAAAFPAAAAAQVATPTLEMVQDISVSAAMSPDLAKARSEAAKPFVHPPPPGHQTGHPGNGAPHVNPPHPAHPQHPAHPVTPSHPVPPQTHPYYPPPPTPYHPPQGPGWHPNPYHPPHPYNPPGYYPPQGPGHHDTTPVVHHPGSGSKWAIVGAVLLAVLLVVILL